LGKADFCLLFSSGLYALQIKASFPFSSPLGAFKKINSDLSFLAQMNVFKISCGAACQQ
jgi:hypothetical protein